MVDNCCIDEVIPCNKSLMPPNPDKGKGRPMSKDTWTQRQHREAHFYEKYAPRQCIDTVDFSPVQGRESRPWNPYWYVYELVRHRFLSCTQQLLDFGCGIGIAALRFAYLGYHVEGFDLSPANIRIARQLAEKHQLTQRCRFRQMVAEKLNYPDNHFDVIVGIDILHHVEIPQAIEEVYRVLKPGGIAIFKEHIEVPILDPIRNTAVFQAVAPKNLSLEHHITEDERKLNQSDLDTVRQRFDHMATKRFTLVSRLDRLLPGCSDALRGHLQKLDQHLIRGCPPLAAFGGTTVMTCHKTNQESSSRHAAA